MISELVKDLCQQSPVCAALRVGGPLSSQFKRAQFRMEHLSPTEPVEYILDSTENKTFQYVPILPLLSELLNKRHIQKTILENKRSSDVSSGYKSFHDGSFLRENSFLCEGENKLPLILYIDDIPDNSLGTSRKKHKVTAVYCVFADIPATLRSTLTSIYLTILCKANDVNQYGYAKVLDPLIKDLKSFEDMVFLFQVWAKWSRALYLL